MAWEQAIRFACQGETLPGVVHHGRADAATGVLVIVGGPQYRVGSHRQFVLLARDLAARGIPVMRFDARGMGDASGSAADFTALDADIAAAVDAFIEHTPRLDRVVLWGLCDAASAALFYAWQDPRIAGMVLLNPWARTPAGEARTYLRHYYTRRLMSRAFWQRLLGGRVAWRTSLAALGANLRRSADAAPDPGAATDALPALSLPERMAAGLERFAGPALFVLSGNDLTAAEFRDAAARSHRWRRLRARDNLAWTELAEADHTFSRRSWRDEVARRTGDWVLALGPAAR